MAEKVDPVKAAAERKKVLKRFGLIESDLKSLRKLGAEEARWRIENEYKNGLEFLKRRRAFMLKECATRVQMRAANPIPVNPRPATRTMGVKIG